MDYLSSLLCQATRMASQIHDGATLHDGRTPYLLHAMETVSIAATMTEDEDVLAAAVLHGALESAAATEEELRDTVGGHVTDLVLAAGEDRAAEGETAQQWRARRQKDIEKLVAEVRIEVKMVVLADKLSNMRAMEKAYNLKGEGYWDAVEGGKDGQMWFYQAATDALQDLNGYPAWHELSNLVWEVFSQDRDSDQLRFDFSARNARELDMLLW